MSEIRIQPYTEGDRAEVLDVINGAFESPRTAQWFAWKHLDGPWGASEGVVARDDEGIVGVRLLLPWEFRSGDRTIVARRAVEASTLPRARGQGVFSRLNRALMEGQAAEGPPTFLFSTPNRLSRDGYAKLGWRWLEPVPHRYELVMPRALRGIRILDGDHALRTYRAPVSTDLRLRTRWHEDALRWRVDPRSGNRYLVFAAERGDAVGGVVARPLRQNGARLLLLVTSWGDAAMVRAAVTAAARHARAITLLRAGSTYPHRAAGVRRGGSLLAVWSPSPTAWERLGLADVDRWAVDFAELEGLL